MESLVLILADIALNNVHLQQEPIRFEMIECAFHNIHNMLVCVVTDMN